MLNGGHKPCLEKGAGAGTPPWVHDLVYVLMGTCRQRRVRIHGYMSPGQVRLSRFSRYVFTGACSSVSTEACVYPATRFFICAIRDPECAGFVSTTTHSALLHGQKNGILSRAASSQLHVLILFKLDWLPTALQLLAGCSIPHSLIQFPYEASPRLLSR